MDPATGWSDFGEDGRETSCTIRLDESGGYRVVVSIDGEPLFGRRCGDLAEAMYVSNAIRRDTRRGVKP